MRVCGANVDLPVHAARHARLGHGRAKYGCYPSSQLLPITNRTTRCFPPSPQPLASYEPGRAARAGWAQYAVVAAGGRHAGSRRRLGGRCSAVGACVPRQCLLSAASVLRARPASLCDNASPLRACSGRILPMPRLRTSKRWAYLSRCMWQGGRVLRHAELACMDRTSRRRRCASNWRISLEELHAHSKACQDTRSKQAPGVPLAVHVAG